jgi:hypothetical protein
MRINRGFTIGKYIELCETILSSRYILDTVTGYLSQRNPSRPVAIIRHDVDLRIRNAVSMAELEADLGIKATYYFRYPLTFDPDAIKRVQDLGHEVGYHYEVLSKTRGDYEQALSLFVKELAAFRSICEINTICMHGSPISGFDNRDLWLRYDFRDFRILGDAYLSFIISDLTYLSDTGRSWAGTNSVRDHMPGAINANPIRTTDDLITLIKSERETGLYITAHPVRWASDNAEWVEGYVRDLVYNTGKKILMAVR